MRYRVKGISRNTGLTTTLIVDAKHHEAAQAIANRQIIVSEVVPEGGLAEPEVFDRNAFDNSEDRAKTHPLPPPSAPARKKRSRGIWAIAVAILLLIVIVLVVWRKS